MGKSSEHYQRLLKDHDITCSMNRKANCWDNAPMESFFATFKKELVHQEEYKTRTEARHSLFGSIEIFYNTRRAHMQREHLPPTRELPEEVSTLDRDQIVVWSYVGGLVKLFERRAA